MVGSENRNICKVPASDRFPIVCCNGILRLSRDGGKTFEALTDVMGLPTGHSTRTVIDRRRLFLITGASGVFQRRLD